MKLTMLSLLLRLLAIIVLNAVMHQRHHVHGNDCAEYTKHISVHHPTETYQSPNPLGKWVSSRCEITPGLKYIVRRFDIQTSMFWGYIYHYEDSWCQTPSFIIKVKGSYELLPGTATPNSKSSFATNFNFEEIYIRMTDTNQLETVVNYILKKCNIALPAVLQKMENETINSNEYIYRDVKFEKGILNKKACRYFFGLHINSFKKIRMVKTNIARNGIKYDELYFGDIPSKDMNQKTHEYVEFQYSLSRMDRPSCDVCAKVKEVNNSPVLPVPKHVKHFKGEWITEMCEAQDDTKFLSKYYEFSDILPNKDYGIVTIYQSYFADSDCNERQFDIKTGGIYYDVEPDTRIKGVTKVTIKITWLSLTGYDDGTLKVMRDGHNCGEAQDWTYGKEQNVTSTNGCRELGLVIPATLKMKTRIIKINNDKTELYINDDSPGKYFTNNLISCSSLKRNITRHTTTTTPSKPKTNLPIDNSVNQHIEDVLLKEVGLGVGHSSGLLLKNSIVLLLVNLAILFLLS